jgi:type I restriction enzyme R subunit
MREYNKFSKGAANSNTSTEILACQIADTNYKIIITTIQKLSIYLKNYKDAEPHQSIIRALRFVIIFDECHRTQFGDMHELITKSFKISYIRLYRNADIRKKRRSLRQSKIKNHRTGVWRKSAHIYNP